MFKHYQNSDFELTKRLVFMAPETPEAPQPSPEDSPEQLKDQPAQSPDQAAAEAAEKGAAAVQKAGVEVTQFEKDAETGDIEMIEVRPTTPEEKEHRAEVAAKVEKQTGGLKNLFANLFKKKPEDAKVAEAMKDQSTEKPVEAGSDEAIQMAKAEGAKEAGETIASAVAQVIEGSPTEGLDFSDQQVTQVAESGQIERRGTEPRQAADIPTPTVPPAGEVSTGERVATVPPTAPDEAEGTEEVVAQK